QDEKTGAHVSDDHDRNERGGHPADAFDPTQDDGAGQHHQGKTDHPRFDIDDTGDLLGDRVGLGAVTDAEGCDRAEDVARETEYGSESSAQSVPEVVHGSSALVDHSGHPTYIQS